MISAMHSAAGLPVEALGAVALSNAIRDAVAMGEERLVLMLRFSALPRARRFGTRAELLREAWEPLNSTARVRSFKLPGGDLVAIGLPNASEALEQERQILFSMLEPEEAEQAVHMLRLPQQAAAVMAAVEDSLGMVAAMRAMALEEPENRTVDTAALAAAERGLNAADLSIFFRQQKVCWLEPGGQNSKLFWEDRRAELSEVCDRLLPGYDISLTPAFAQRLLKSIDRRQLSDIARPEEMLDMRTLALPLRMESLFSTEFLRLDSFMPQSQRHKLIIGLDAEDVLAAPDVFLLARNFAKARGYRLMLEAGSPFAASVVSSLRGSFDFLRLQWSEDFPAPDSPSTAMLRNKLPNAAEHIVLAGADRAAAIAWGWEAGIRMFQGRLIESQRQGG
ncbi:MAG: hypothetical protein INF74_06205 [Roseomonas sp.]|nr:hypothetical protein [Roseomonas sp.]